MTREIKAPEPVLSTAKSSDGLHELQFNDKSHRYKWVCPCHLKASSVGTTTFIKSTYPTSVGLTNWMKSQAMKALFETITYPADDGYYPKLHFWPVSEDKRKDIFKACRDAHEEVAQEAADIGTICHSFAELHSLGKLDEANALLDKVKGVQKWSLIKACVDKYLEWSATNKGTLIKAEELVASPTLLYCGKFDRLDLVGDVLRLRDYKTSKDIFTDQFIQLSAYRRAIKEWFGLEVGELEVLRFGKDDGTFDTLTSVQLAEKLEMDHTELLNALERQAIRCRETYDFLKLDSWRKR